MIHLLLQEFHRQMPAYEFFVRLKESTQMLGTKLSPELLLYYDLLDRINLPQGSTIWGMLNEDHNIKV
jgi:hypothetical protein